VVVSFDLTVAPPNSVTAHHHQIGFHVVSRMLVDVMERETACVSTESALAPTAMEFSQ
jgi:hypothetical protein